MGNQGEMLFIRAASGTVVRMAGFLVGLVGLRGYRGHTHLIGGFPQLASQSGSGFLLVVLGGCRHHITAMFVLASAPCVFACFDSLVHAWLSGSACPA